MGFRLKLFVSKWTNTTREHCTVSSKNICYLFCLLIIARVFAQVPANNVSQQPKTSPQTLQTLSSYEGQSVVSIELAGRPDIDVDRFQQFLVQHAGEPFSKQKVDETIAALKRDGKFQEIQLQVVPVPDGVRLLLVLEPAVYFGIFQFPGAERFPYSRLVQVANYPSASPFNAGEIARDRDSLVNFFREQGFFQVRVDPELKTEPSHGLADVSFHSTLSRRAKFGDVKISGTSPEESAMLAKNLRSWGAKVRGTSIRPGKTYHYSNIMNGSKYLQSRLEKEGRLAAKVQPQGAEYHAESNRADIHFDVHTGPVIHVDVKGAHLWSWQRKSLLPLYHGAGVDRELVLEGTQALVSYFQGKGYFDVNVTSDFQRAGSVNTIIYQITKGKKHKVASVDIAGNKNIKTDDLMNQVTVRKGHLFSPGKFSDNLVRSSSKALQAVYQSEGYSTVKITPHVEKNSGDVRVRFIVDEGSRDIVQSLTIQGANTFPSSSFAPHGLNLAEAKPYSQKLVENDRASIIAHYLQAGYLMASFRETANAVSKKDPHHLNVVYHIYEGPRVYTGNVITLGLRKTTPRLVAEDAEAIRPEKPLTETSLLATESKLYDHPGVFDWAQVDPKRQITTQTQEDVLVKVHESQKNQITYGFGFEIINRGGSVPSGTVALPNLPPIGLPSTFTTSQRTFYGPRGTFQYTRNNVRGKGESISFTGFAGRLDQRVAAYYINPRLRWTKWTATTSASYEFNQENPVYSSRIALVSYQIQRYLDNKKENVFFLRYSFSKTDLTRLEIPQLVSPEDEHVRLSTIAANFTRDTRDNQLDEHKGMLQIAELDLNTTKLGSSVDFAKLRFQSAYYKRLFHDIIWANSIRIGLAQPFAGSRVPLSEAFFTGGGNTLRGFPLNSAGPQKQVPVCSTGGAGCTLIQVPTGGNEMLVVNSELRIPLPIWKGLSIVPFYDGGNVFPRVGFHDFTSLYSNNVGLGLRYATPVGPIRIDVGRNLNPIPGIKATQYFVSIGQAF